MTLRPSDLVNEIRLASRLLARRPGFLAVAVVTLAIGIGGPTAIFSVVQAVLLRDLPYPEADRLIEFRLQGRAAVRPVVFDALPASVGLRWAAQSETLSGLALSTDSAVTLTTAEGPFRLNGVAATPNLFEVLRVRPLIGAAFDANTTDAHRMLISYDTWQRHFAGRAEAIGSIATVNGQPYLIAGVMPRDFGFPSPETTFWVPLLMQDEGRGMLLRAVARLRDGATLPAVVEEGQRWLQEEATGRNAWTLSVRTMYDQLVGGVRRLVWVLMGAVAFVCAIATANMALLLMTRGTARTREFSVRLALGAGRRRLTRQLFVEGMTLASIGGLAGVGLAEWLLAALLRFAPADMPRLQSASVDGPVLAFAFALTVLTSLMFGVLSAGPALATDPIRSLGRLGGDGSDGATRAVRRRLGVLAAGELALTMVLLVGAGLLIRSFVRVVLVDQGFSPGGAVALQVSLPAGSYASPESRLAFYERLLERLSHLQDVTNGGLIIMMPNRQPSARMDFSASEISPSLDPFSRETIPTRTASEGFFEAMGIPIRAGRGFRADDRPGSEPVLVISSTLARREFGDRNPVGQTMYSRLGTYRIVGVVGDVKPAAQDQEIGPAAYLPLRQDPWVFRSFATATVVARGNNPTGLASSLRALVLSLDPNVPPFNVRTLADEVGGFVAGPRFSASALASFAVIALILAAIGVYGVMSYLAGQRTREIGVRVALGATRLQILRMMLRDGAAIVGLGLMAGLIGAAWLAQTLTGLLHEVTPADPVSLASVAVVLLLAGGLAVYIPARRATRISPVEALRES